VSQDPAGRIDCADDPERKGALVRWKQVGDEGHAHRHHRAGAEGLNHTADNQGVERGESGRGTHAEQLHDPLGDLGGPAWRGRDDP
jgi:hypothetical protein